MQKLCFNIADGANVEEAEMKILRHNDMTM
jgi:hypothetical protein